MSTLSPASAAASRGNRIAAEDVRLRSPEGRRGPVVKAQVDRPSAAAICRAAMQQQIVAAPPGVNGERAAGRVGSTGGAARDEDVPTAMSKAFSPTASAASTSALGRGASAAGGGGEIQRLTSEAMAAALALRHVTPSMALRGLGKGVCMCRAMGMCPLMAFVHRDDCVFCNDPLISRYYPCDDGWWSTRAAVDDLRRLAGFDLTVPDEDGPTPVIA